MANPKLTESTIKPGDKVTILDNDRIARLKVLRAYKSDIESTDRDLDWFEGRTLDGGLRASRAGIQDARNDTLGALRNAMAMEFRHAAGGKAHDSAALDVVLDEMTADLKAQGFDDAESIALAKSARTEFETGLDDLFEPVRDKISASQDDPSKWDTVEAALVDEFEELVANNPNREAAINAARETLHTFGPEDARWRRAVDRAGITVLIERPAEEVKAAYEKDGGAEAALAKLRQVTKDLTPETSALVVEEARPTLDLVFADLGTYLEKRQNTRGRTVDISTLNLSPVDFRVALSDLSLVANQLSRSAASRPTLDGLILELADAVPDVRKNHTGATSPDAYDQDELGTTLRDLIHLRREPVPGETRIEDGQAPVLGLMLADALVKSRRPAEADVVLFHVTKGLEDRFDALKLEAEDAFVRTDGIPDQWQALTGKDASDSARNAFEKKHSGYVKTLGSVGKKGVLLVDALWTPPDSLESLKNFKGFDQARKAYLSSEWFWTAVAASSSAWPEMGRIFLEAEAPQEARAPTPYWAERSLILWGKAFQGMNASAFPESNRLTGKPFSLPPSVANTTIAADANKLTPEERNSALRAARDLNTPGALNSASERKAARDTIAGVFERQKPSVNNWASRSFLLGTDGNLTPREGASSTSAYGRGLTIVMAPLYVVGGLDLLKQANDPNVGGDAWLYKTFGVYMQAGALRELSMLTAGMTQARVAKGKLPVNGTLDRITRFSGVKGYKSYEWFPRWFDLVANGLLTYYAGTLYTDGDWQRGMAFTAAAGGGWVDLVGTMKKSPKTSLAGLGISAAGIVIDYGINKHRQAQTVARYEGSTREYLELAGVRPEIAKELANYDSDGNSVAPLLVQVAKERGQTSEEFLKFLNGRSGQEMKRFIEAAHHVKPDDKGKYPRTKGNDVLAIGPRFTYLYGNDAGPYSNGTGYAAPWNYPESVKALADFSKLLFK